MPQKISYVPLFMHGCIDPVKPVGDGTTLERSVTEPLQSLCQGCAVHTGWEFTFLVEGR